MGFWQKAMSWLDNTPNHEGVTPNVNGPADYAPGDPGGVEFQHEDTFTRALPFPAPSVWSGWPAEWSTPQWQGQHLNKLIDTAWACLDLNARVLAAMPVYRTRSGRIISPLKWMVNPDPMIYSSWQEFAKQLFWDLLLGEAFVMPFATGSDGYPLKFRVMPPWLVNVELRGGRREYKLGTMDVTDEILHIRYQSNMTDARGHGPLEAGAPRMVTAGLLRRYAERIAETGGVPHYWIGIDARLNQAQAMDYLDQWVESRQRHAGHPALLTGGGKLNQAQSMSARDMTLLELAQFTESGLAVLLGVPPYMVGLPGPGGLTYANVSQLTDHHDRAMLKPAATAVMQALSGWALPYGQAVELNRDEYTRPPFNERVEGYSKLFELVDEFGRRGISIDEIRAAERLNGAPSTTALTGGEATGTEFEAETEEESADG